MSIPYIYPDIQSQVKKGGLLLVNKPAGWSSFKAVAIVRRILSEAAQKKVKVGHAGTLDPFATGLLILLIGDACKEAGSFLKKDKIYEVTAHLGVRSTTGDPEGEQTIVSEKIPTEEQVLSAVKHYVGEIMQKPPAFSAIKVDGVRAYKKARKGETVEIAARRVTIHAIDAIEYAYPLIRFRCHVSSGTYIRSLVEDIGDFLEVGAFTEELRRTRIDGFAVEDALAIDPDTTRAVTILESIAPIS
jgi:tRNA pseudouridine55 synthase